MSESPEGGCVPCRVCGGSQNRGWHLHDRATTAPATLANALAEALQVVAVPIGARPDDAAAEIAALLTAPGGWLDSLLAPIAELADEWGHPAEVYALRMSAAPRLRAALAAARPAERERGGA